MTTILVPTCSSMSGLEEKLPKDMPDGTYVLIRHLKSGQWVVLKVVVRGFLVDEVSTGQYTNGNSYEAIRVAFRQVLDCNPDKTILVLEGDVTLSSIEKPVLNYLGNKTFEVKVESQPIPFPKYGY